MSVKGFLDLPRPVRDRIYGLLFTRDEIFYPLHSWGALVEGIALVRCCQTICEEGCNVLYGSNRLVLNPKTVYQLWLFLDIIGESNRRLLGHVCIDLFGCQDEVDSMIRGTQDLVPGLKLLEDTWFETLELHLGEFSPHLPCNRAVKQALSCMRTEVLKISQRAETRYWTAMARVMCATRLHILLPIGVGPEHKELFNIDHFQEKSDLIFDIELPEYLFAGLPPEMRNII